jgi:hypothetical protein
MTLMMLHEITITLNNLHLQSPCLHLSLNRIEQLYLSSFAFEGPLFFPGHSPR